MPGMGSALTRVRAAIDLASIMVGVIVIALIAGAISASVFAVIPWTQDQAAASQIAEVKNAQASRRGLDPAHLFGNYQNLVNAGVLKDDIAGLCVTTTANGIGWTAAAKSPTGKVFTLNDRLDKPQPGSISDYDTCSSTGGAVGTTFDAGNVEPTIMRLTVDTAILRYGSYGASCQNFILPANGTVNAKVNWGDGTAEETVTTAFKAHAYPAGGAKYNVTIDGTFTQYGAYANSTTSTATGYTGCVNKVDHWGRSTGTTAAYGAYSYFPSSTGVVQPPSTVTSYRRIFERTPLFNQAIGTWDVANVTAMDYAFSYAEKFNQPLAGWNVTNVTNMSQMFSDTSMFSADISTWNTSKVTSMDGMFAWSAFNQPIGDWDVSKVTTFSEMFYFSPINQDISRWNVSSATNMNWMFYHAANFNSGITLWNTSRVTSLTCTFAGTRAFNQPIGTWDTSKVKDFSETFRDADGFNQNINSWDTRAATSFDSTFRDTATFNQPLDNWKTANATSMDSMFQQALAFNQNISGWNVAQVTSHASFNTGGVISPVNLPAGY